MKKCHNDIRILFFVGCFALSACVTDSQEVEEPEKEVSASAIQQLGNGNYDLNISILLDLSDRIDSTLHPNNAMQYYTRDLGYISSIAEAFHTHVKSKKIRTMNDQMQIYFEPAPANTTINHIAQKLKIRLNKKTASMALLNQIKTNYSLLPDSIYKAAVNSQKYPGSNIWGFFSSKAADYCIKAGSRNILVVITDGYIFHEDAKLKQGNRTNYITAKLIRDFGLIGSDWQKHFEKKGYGLISKANLLGLNVLVLGINTNESNKYDEEVLRLYWSNWFKEMGITNSEIKTADLPANLDEVIQNYILNKAT